MENLKETGKIVSALLVGALCGVAIGVLFAPDKGSRTRRRLIGSAQDLAEDLKQKMKDEAEVFRARAEELEQLAENKLETLSHNVSKHLDFSSNHQ